MSSYPEKFEAARQVYLEQRDRWMVNQTEEDLEKANAAFRIWLDTSQIYFRPPLHRKRICVSRMTGD
jgi:hypothetical protein